MRLSIQAIALATAVLALACGPAAAPPASAPAKPAPAPPSSPPSIGGVTRDTTSVTGGPSAPASPAWQNEWERTVAAARQEGSVVVNGPAGDTIRRAMVDGFQKAYPGITLEWTGGTAPEFAAKLEAERRAGLHALDVLISGTSVMLTQVKTPGYLDPLKPALLLPEVTDTANWLDGRLEFADNEGQYDLVFITLPQGVAAHNPTMVRADEIDELPKLLDPKWKGKIVISDPAVGGTGQALFRWLWVVLGPDKAPDYIRALKAQAGAVDRDRRRMVEWVARGRYAVVFNPEGSILQQLKQEGLPVEVLPGFKDYGTYITASFGSMGLVNRAPHPNAAKVFANWLLTKDGQTAYSIATRQPSRRLDVPRDHLPPEYVIRPDGKYWRSYLEPDVELPPEFVSLMAEVFGR